MKKVYISPVTEIVASQMNQEVMAGHSQGWGDAKGINFDEDAQDEEDLTPKNLWDD